MISRTEFHGEEDDGKIAVSFFLAPGGIMATSEVLAYDFFDLVGNVGGFLGLFLGVSILSLFDNARMVILK